jgi:hypothetical protein
LKKISFKNLLEQKQANKQIKKGHKQKNQNDLRLSMTEGGDH